MFHIVSSDFETPTHNQLLWSHLTPIHEMIIHMNIDLRINYFSTHFVFFFHEFNDQLL